MTTLNGKGVSKSVAIGKISFLAHDDYVPEKIHTDNPSVELAKFKKILQTVSEQLDSLYDVAVKKVGEKEADIFNIHKMILEDEDFTESIESFIADERVNCEYAVYKTAQKFAEVFSSMDDSYMKARATDIKDVSMRLIDTISGRLESDILNDENIILVADDLAPSETIQLDKDKIIAFVTEKGSENSHTAILARSMNIPAIVDIGKISRKYDGKKAIVDGTNGVIYIEPNENIILEFEKRLSEDLMHKKKLKSYIGKETVTKSGKRINLYANIGSPDDVQYVLKNDAEGIGLFRSEFLFLGRTAPPDEEEQLKAYKSVLKSLCGKKVIVRTFDIGADKQVDYLGLPQEENPAMGLRAIRICLENKTLFRTQLRALYRASVHGNLSIMFPMITSIEEILEIKEVISHVKAGLIKDNLAFRDDVEIGIMIETPAAAIISDKLAKEVDFFSLGTNDLIAYTLAADRQNTHLERYVKNSHSAVLRLIQFTIESGHKNGIWVGMCGEMAADTSITDTLVSMGIDELSVVPSAVLNIRAKIINYDGNQILDY